MIKSQIDLLEYGNPYNLSAKVHLFLPCSKIKPYKNSKSHKFIVKKLSEGLAPGSLGFVQINTISEVKGVVPQHLEDEIFSNPDQHYDLLPENSDIARLGKLLCQFVMNTPERDEKFFVFYATQIIFREICCYANKELKKYAVGQYTPPNILLVPYVVENPAKALFEFRMKNNADVLVRVIKNKIHPGEILRKRGNKTFEVF